MTGMRNPREDVCIRFLDIYIYIFFGATGAGALTVSFRFAKLKQDEIIYNDFFSSA